MKCRQGSITIFSLLSLLLITATLFALLEGTRLQEMRRFAKLQTETALESGFANYNSGLWQNYHLLAADKNQLQEIVEVCARGKTEGKGVNFFRLNPQEIEIESHTLLTDASGKVFVHSVSSYMKENILYEAAKEIYSQYEAIKGLMKSNEMDVSDIEEAIEEIEAIEETEETEESASFGTTSRKQSKTKVDVKSILETAKKWQKMGILELVLEDTEKVSQAKMDEEHCLLNRNLETGTKVGEVELKWEDSILLQQYLLTYLSNYREPQDNRALSYELEYLLGKKASDIENLKIVTTKLLAVREAANFVYLVSNPEKVAQAETIATVIAGASLNPIVIQAVKIGLLTAWAFAESILDVRTLLAGKRIALLKSDETWTTELENLGMAGTGFAMAKESKLGLSYQNYVGILLLFEKEQSLAMRTMSVQEAAIREQYQDDTFQMDKLLVQAVATIDYTYNPIFPFLQTIDAENKWERKVFATEQYGYY